MTAINLCYRLHTTLSPHEGVADLYGGSEDGGMLSSERDLHPVPPPHLSHHTVHLTHQGSQQGGLTRGWGPDYQGQSPTGDL